jgi:hypothetical protein
MRLFENKLAAIFGTLIYTLSGTIWAQMVYSDGFFPNFVGVLLELTLMVAFLDLSSNYKSRSTWVVSGIVLIASYFSHYSALALFGTFALFAVVMVITRKNDARGTVYATIAFLAPAAIGVIPFWKTVIRDLNISYLSGTPQPLTTPLSKALGSIPSFAYLAYQMQNDIGFIATIALLAGALYYAVKHQDARVALPLIWFLGLLIASPQDYSAWRFSLEAVLPLTLLAGYGLPALFPQRSTKTRRAKGGDLRRLGAILVAVLFMSPIVIPGWTSQLAGPLAQNTSAVAQVQGLEFQAMSWLGQNTSSVSRSLSITDPTFLYAGIYVSRNCSFMYFGNETQAISYAEQNGISFLIVTKYNVFFNRVQVAQNPSATNLPWFTYISSSSAKLVYSNSDVKVFQVVLSG